METIKQQKLIEKILVIFLMIQPIFDLKIFYNSISTLIRVIVIGLLFIYFFINDKNKKKYYLAIYVMVFFIYFIFHHINAIHFNSFIPNNFNYSVIKEGLYFVKMLTPFLLIYCLYQSKIPLKHIIKSIVITMSLIIIITNIFGISYGSYSDKKIEASFFKWFNNENNYTYQDLASKGLFEYANQISAILIILLPILMLDIVDSKHKKLDLIVIFFNIWALILLATKVAVIGIAVDIVLVGCVILFDKLVNKERNINKSFLLLVLPIAFYIITIPFNPMFDRMNERKTIISTFSEGIANKEDAGETEYLGNNTSVENEGESITINTAEQEQICEENVLDEQSQKMQYIERIAEEKKLKKQFYMDNYPYEYDTDFWYSFVERDGALISNNRYVEEEMVKRVVEVNNNTFDKYLGITNTRLQNIFNIEKDFVVQYYALGMIGLILVFLPYFSILFIETIKMFKVKFKIITKYSYLCIGLIVFTFGISYCSGNLLNSLGFIIYFAMIYGVLLTEQTNKDFTIKC